MMDKSRRQRLINVGDFAMNAAGAAPYEGDPITVVVDGMVYVAVAPREFIEFVEAS